MSPTFSRGQSGRAYRYYVSAPLLQGSNCGYARVKRLSATAIERVLGETIERWLGSPDPSLSSIHVARLVDDGLIIELGEPAKPDLALRLLPGERILHHAKKSVSIHLPLTLPLRGGQRLVAAGAKRTANPDPVLIAALRKAHRMAERDRGIPTVRVAPESPYDRKILRLAILAPDLQRDIIAGLHPPHLNLEGLMKAEIPLAWSEQRSAPNWSRAE